MSDLNSRQQQFCIEYAKGKSATQAYMDAGYEPKDRHSAGSSAFRLLQKDKIMKEYRRIKNIRETRTSARKNTAVAEALSLALQQFGEIRKLLKKVASGQELTEDQRMVLSKVMSIISSLSREDVINIQQMQSQGQEGGFDLTKLHERIQEDDKD